MAVGDNLAFQIPEARLGRETVSLNESLNEGLIYTDTGYRTLSNISTQLL